MAPLLYDVSMAELLRLREEEGMTNREIAEHLDVSVATIYRYLGKQPKKGSTMKNTHSTYTDTQDDLAKAIRTPEEVVAGMSDAQVSAMISTLCDGTSDGGLRSVGATFKAGDGTLYTIEKTEEGDVEIAISGKHIKAQLLYPEFCALRVQLDNLRKEIAKL